MLCIHGVRALLVRASKIAAMNDEFPWKLARRNVSRWQMDLANGILSGMIY